MCVLQGLLLGTPSLDLVAKRLLINGSQFYRAAKKKVRLFLVWTSLASPLSWEGCVLLSGRSGYLGAADASL